MNRRSIIKSVTWLLVIFTGIAFGAGVYEARVALPQWLTTVNGVTVWHADIAKAADPGLNFWAYVTTGPITLLTLVSLVMVWKTQGPIKRWWLITLFFLLIDRTMTFGYFIPTMTELMSDKLSVTDAVHTAQQWARLDVVRLVASGLSYVAAIRLLVELYRKDSTFPFTKSKAKDS